MFQQQLHHEQPLKRTDHEVDFETGQLMERLLAEELQEARDFEVAKRCSSAMPSATRDLDLPPTHLS